jgi:hypothetical protein
MEKQDRPFSKCDSDKKWFKNTIAKKAMWQPFLALTLIVEKTVCSIPTRARIRQMRSLNYFI